MQWLRCLYATRTAPSFTVLVCSVAMFADGFVYRVVSIQNAEEAILTFQGDTGVPICPVFAAWDK